METSLNPTVSQRPHWIVQQGKQFITTAKQDLHEFVQDPRKNSAVVAVGTVVAAMPVYIVRYCASGVTEYMTRGSSEETKAWVNTTLNITTVALFLGAAAYNAHTSLKPTKVKKT
jgi:hypothetical protein